MKVYKAGIWAILGSIFPSFVSVPTLLVLARLITPEEFGVFGIVMIINGFLLPFMDMGLLQVYIKKKAVTEETRNAYFTVNFITALFLICLLFICAPYVARYYDISDLTLLIYTYSLSVLFYCLAGQWLAVLTRDKRMDVIAKTNLKVSLISNSVVISLAVLGFGIWALVIRLVCESILRFYLLWKAVDWNCRVIEIRLLRRYEHDIKFGLSVVFSRFFASVAMSLDKIFLSNVLDIGAFGAYSRMQQLADMPNASIRVAISTPSLAYICRLKEKKDKMISHQVMTTLIIGIAGAPCVLLMIASEPLTTILFGSEWDVYSWILGVMGVYGILRILQGLAMTFNVDMNSPRLSTHAFLGSALFVAAPLIVLTAMKVISIDDFIIYVSVVSMVYWYVSLVVFHMIPTVGGQRWGVIRYFVRNIISFVVSYSVALKLFTLFEGPELAKIALTILSFIISYFILNIFLDSNFRGVMLRIVSGAI